MEREKSIDPSKLQNQHLETGREIIVQRVVRRLTKVGGWAATGLRKELVEKIAQLF